MHVAELTDPADNQVQRAFVASFQQHCSIERQWIQRAAAVRATDPNTTQTELARLDRIRNARS
jgi:hypothetical protein